MVDDLYQKTNQRNDIYETNVKLAKKNQILKQELDELKKSRSSNAYAKAWSTSTKREPILKKNVNISLSESTLSVENLEQKQDSKPVERSVQNRSVQNTSVQNTSVQNRFVQNLAVQDHSVQCRPASAGVARTVCVVASEPIKKKMLRPSSAHHTKKVPIASSRPQSASRPSSSSDCPSGKCKENQQEERQRLQSLITASDWDMQGQSDMYVFGKLLGQGSFGTVRLAYHKITGHKVAIKTCEKSRFKDENQLNRCRQEIQLMEQLNHIHISRLFETLENTKRIHMVMEAATGGNLCTYVKSKKRLVEAEAVGIFHQLILGLDYLHSNGIVHRDVKLENVLFDANKVIKLVDFGFSVISSDRKLKVFCGTPSYMAPEIVRRKEYVGFPVDVWSLGVLFYAMLCGRFPFAGKGHPDLYKKIAKGEYNMPESASASAQDSLKRMLCLNPSMRISIKQLKSHRILANEKSLFSENSHHNDCVSLISEDPKNDIQPNLVKQLTDFGFNKEKLVKSIIDRKRNHPTTTYYLLAMKAEKKRQSMQEYPTSQKIMK